MSFSPATTPAAGRSTRPTGRSRSWRRWPATAAARCRSCAGWATSTSPSTTSSWSGWPPERPYNRAMLSERQELILRKVVEGHMELGQPVGSRALAADPELSWGPSTIRHELAVLEEHDLLEHPHT